MSARPVISALFVCSAHHCCSPAAYGIAKAIASERQLDWLHVDAANTSAESRGHDPHPLTVAEGARRGYRIDHRARPVHPDDFADFDLIVAMDQSNLDDLRRLGGSLDQRIGPYGVLEPLQLQLLRRWDPYGMPGDEDIIEPWGRDLDAYAEMYDVLERSVPPLLDHLAWLMEDITRDAP